MRSRGIRSLWLAELAIGVLALSTAHAAPTDDPKLDTPAQKEAPTAFAAASVNASAIAQTLNRRIRPDFIVIPG